MASKKIITVFGATGAQGGGLVRSILNDKSGEFAARAVTRDINSDKAKALAALGAEVVSGDVDDAASVEKALEGAYGAYFVTFFWNHYSPELEIAQAQTFATAAKKAGLQHAIWSTLEDVREFVPLHNDSIPTLKEKYKVPHFDAKGEANKFFIEAGVPTTFLYASFYWENFIYFGAGPKKAADGKLHLTLPIGDAKMGGIASEDIGKCAYGIFKKGKELIGKKVGLAGAQLSGEEMADDLSKAIGQPILYNKIPASVYRSFGFPGADDLGNMFQFYDDFEEHVNSLRDVDSSRQLNPELQSFPEWLKENAKLIPLE
ncbi:MAG: NmrA/HSCARG family protein [Chitinophagaceae bacterium]